MLNDIVKTTRIKKIFFSELLEEEKNLFYEALKVRNNAQAPYSNYHVGVAILSEKGTVHVGCNVERCTWTQTTHAEQNAIDTMVSACGPVKIKKVAVIAAPKNSPVSLTEQNGSSLSCVICGHCLQTIWENCFNDPSVEILTYEGNNVVACSTVGDLLPMRFGPADLNVSYKK
jgi:cytidine deaminase